MATHHGRPGGRVLELCVGLALVLVSATLLGAALAACLGIFYTLFMLHAWLGVGFVMALAMSSSWWAKLVFPPIFRSIHKVLSLIWTPFLTYYRYEPGTLRPIITTDETKK